MTFSVYLFGQLMLFIDKTMKFGRNKKQGIWRYIYIFILT